MINTPEDDVDLKDMQPQLIYNLNNEQLNDEEFEKLFVCCVKLGVNAFSLDDAVSSLNQAMKLLLRKTDQFPSKDILHGVQELIERLTSNPRGALYLSSNTSWTGDLLTVIKRLLQTFKISEEYITLCFEISAAMLILFGTKWFKTGDVFPVLLCSLASGQLRMVVEEPDSINALKLIPVISILEFFIDAVDETDFFSDEDATKMSYHIKDACTFLFEYIAECHKQQQTISEDVMVMFYKLLCTFLSIGGMEMLSQDSVTPAIEPMMNVAQSFIMQENMTLAGLFLYNLPAFKSLPQNTLSFILNYLQLKPADYDKTTIFAQVSSILEQLSGRKDFCTDNSKQEAIKLAAEVGDHKLSEQFAAL
uniref:Uncharacterized protein n=1 Tax=Panagrolaimus superbus TaxID=310955 RepID=A0A914YSM5_9BILA